MSTMIERFRMMLNPLTDAQHAAVDELAHLDEPTLAILYELADRAHNRPIIFVQSDDDEIGGYQEPYDE